MRFNYEVINEDSNIAIVTLWSGIDQVKRLLGDSIKLVGIIGNLYTPIGINYIVATLSGFNWVDTLIVFGLDYNGVGDLLIKFFRDGVLDVLLVDRDIADGVRSTVRVIDLREAFKARNADLLIKTVHENYRPGRKPVRPSMRVEVRENEHDGGWVLPLVGGFIYERDTYRSWVKLVDLVLNYGFDKGDYRELITPLVVIDSMGKPHPFRRLSDAGLKGFEPPAEVVEAMVRELRINPYSINAVYYGGDYLVQGVISGDYYNQVVYLRSVDVLNDWCRQLYRWWSLARRIVEALNSEFNAWYSVGSIAVMPFSARIYAKDLSRAEEFVRRNANVFSEFVEDPRGNFLVMREGESVIVEHRLPITNSLHRRFSFKSLEEAYNTLKNSNHFTNYSHAMYLGKELARVFLLRNYEQDKL
ncbi:hypothetical protein [Vulcanisaeta sp. JCM 16159]|uniref:DUF4346 domain-containing protein n=1 Tax=Vulcanisaeta sp. JCM 16159 TaxID=1295371 RepID=UPI0006D2696D|nr:hypothetical protein [Vulcanisaeta sp. JCM 16159]